MYSTRKRCLACGGNLSDPVIDLGMMYVVDFVSKKDANGLRAPLTLVRCQSCCLLQLKHHVDPDRLYKHMWYRSSVNPQMKIELGAVVQHAQATVDITEGDHVLDIGCNDGMLLGWYPQTVHTVGVDPCEERVQEGLRENKIDTAIIDYFSAEAVKKQIDTKFKIITSVAMFYDLADPMSFLRDCKVLLHDEGVLVIQMNYLMSMLQNTAFDMICHEHLAYYSIWSLKRIVENAGLEIQGLELSESNGGSLRAYITHRGFDKFAQKDNENKLWLWTNLQVKLKEELNALLCLDEPYIGFAKNMETRMDKLRLYLGSIRKPIYGYGASTRGTTTLQYLYPDGDCPLVSIAERDPKKYGLKMVGTWTPIVSEDEIRGKASHMLVLPWHFKQSIVEREKEWIRSGGEMIFPLPTPSSVSFATQYQLTELDKMEATK